MSTNTTEIVVVGAGLMGAAAAWQLARRGARVTLCEQFDLAHTRGSSHGVSRIFRLAYDQLDYTRLAQQALPLWREVEGELGRPLLWTTSGLDVGPRAQLEPIAATLAAAGVPFERLNPAELAASFPAYALPGDWEALHQADAGVLAADDCRQGLVELARRAGATIHDNTAVTRLLPVGDGVSVETSGGTWQADLVVVTGAGWSNRLLTPLGLDVPITVTREHVAYYPYRGTPTVVPFICHDGALTFEIYGLPNGRRGEAKLGEHGAGPVIDPDAAGEVEPARLERVTAFVRDHLPALVAAPSAAETCLYASTPDDDFVLDRVERIVLGLGFGGHGFKFGPLMGALLADLADGKPIPASARFTRARFQTAPAGAGQPPGPAQHR